MNTRGRILRAFLSLWLLAASQVRADEPKKLEAGSWIRIQIQDLFGPNTVSEKVVQVSETGSIRLPMVKEPIQVAGKTEREAASALEKALKDAGMSGGVLVTIVPAPPATQPNERT